MSIATTAATIRPEEAAHFGKLAAEWWDPKGSSAMLHKLNPVRLGAAVLLLVAWAAMGKVPALGQLGVVAGVVVLALVVETVAFAERRREIRDAHLHHAG